MLTLNTLMQTAKILFPDYKLYFSNKLVKGPNKSQFHDIGCTNYYTIYVLTYIYYLYLCTYYYNISVSFNFLIREDIKPERFQNRFSIKIESFLLI